MKMTDYAARTAPFDYYLSQRFRGWNPVGIELGVDAGAHAESMIKAGRMRHLDLVDPWPGIFYMGICKGRLDALGHYGGYSQHRMPAQQFLFQRVNHNPVYHAIYCDLPQDGQTAQEVVAPLWALLHRGGIFGYRNYCAAWPDMKQVLDKHMDALGHDGFELLSNEANELVLEKK